MFLQFYRDAENLFFVTNVLEVFKPHKRHPHALQARRYFGLATT
jgi:hypothetical protein